MQFHVEFKYDTREREKILHFLSAGALKPDNPVKFVGTWVSIGTGTGFAMIETKYAAAFYDNCTKWSEYGCSAGDANSVRSGYHLAMLLVMTPEAGAASLTSLALRCPQGHHQSSDAHINISPIRSLRKVLIM